MPQRPRELDDFEYQRMYDAGAYPERWWDIEISKAKSELVAGELSITQFEDAVWTIMGFWYLELQTRYIVAENERVRKELENGR